jgi:hypothetical protein
MKYKILIVFLIALSFLVPAAAWGQQNYQLVLEVAPSPLPADGGQYPLYVYLLDSEGLPIKTPQDITISLFSTNPKIVSVPNTVTLPKGSYYVRAYINTTDLPGDCTITAVAEGVTSGSISLTTVYPVGYPVKLGLYAKPSLILPDEDSTLVVQLEDWMGHPVKASRSTYVRLTLSDSDLGDIPSVAVIKKGESRTEVSFSPKGIVGVAKITASAIGFIEATTDIQIKAAEPKALKLFAAPDVLLADGINIGYVAVMIVDKDGYPTLAKEDVTVYLSSSNDTVAFFHTNTTLIPRGEYYSIVIVNTTGLTGNTTLTAHAGNLQSDSVTVRAESAGSYSYPNKLRLFVIPEIFLPDEKVHEEVVVVQLLNEDGIPIALYNDLTVTLSSSKPRFGNVSRNIVVRGGSNTGTGSFITGHVVGDTNLTVTVDGFEPAFFEVKMISAPPAAIRLEQAPPVVKADGEEYEVLVVQLVDQGGNPVRAINDTQVYLLPSDESLIEVPDSVTIPIGENYRVVSIRTSEKPGEVGIFAHSTNLESTEIQVNVEEPYPNVIRLLVEPSVTIADGGMSDIIIWIEGKDSIPARLDRSLNISLFSSDSSIMGTNPYVYLAKGNFYTITRSYIGTEPGTAILSAVAEGFKAATYEAFTLTLPMELTITPLGIPEVGVETPLKLTVEWAGYGIPDASVNVTSTTGEIEMRTFLTDENGELLIYYTPKIYGINEIEVFAKAKGFEIGYLLYEFNATSHPTLTVIAETEAGIPISNADVTLTYQNGTVKTLTTDKDGKVAFVRLDVGNYTVSVPDEIQLTGDTRYKFKSWQDDVQQPKREVQLIYDTEMVAQYIKRYLVLVNSPYGTVNGTGWYDEGSAAIIAISPTTVQTSFFSPPMVFSGWTGDIYSKDVKVAFSVDGPMVINAEWRPDYLAFALNLLPIIIIILAVAAIPLLIRRRIKKKEEEEVEEEELF